MQEVLLEAAQQVPALVVLCGFVFLILRLFRGFLAEQGEVSRALIRELYERQEAVAKGQSGTNAEMAKALDRLTRTVLRHDATVRGTNPKVMGTHHDQMGEIHRELESG